MCTEFCSEMRKISIIITEMFLMIWSYFELYQDIVAAADVLQLRVKFPTDLHLVVDDETVLLPEWFTPGLTFKTSC